MMSSDFSGNYFCTWLSQYKTQPGFEAGCETVNVRDKMTSAFLFGEEGILQAIDERVREDLIVVLDDGWDVPLGTDNPRHRARFGSMELSAERFPDVEGDTPTERLAALSAGIKEMGFRGLGLWVACQCAGENRDKLLPPEQAREQWIKKAQASAAAGVLYWKIDWGMHDSEVEYRAMITEVVRQYAPDLRVEHALMPGFLDAEVRRERKKNVLPLLRVSDFLRTYDVVEEFTYPHTLSRTVELLTTGCRGISGGGSAIINVEDVPVLAAALGCSMGLMRLRAAYWNPACLDRGQVATKNDETVRALLWQRIAPPFGCAEVQTAVSEEKLTDSYRFKVHPLDWTYSIVGNKVLNATAPAAISRGTQPARAVPMTAGGEIPYTVSAVNPLTGASSVATLPRTAEGRLFYYPQARVTAEVGSSDKPVAVFGEYGELTLKFADSIAGKRVTVRDILQPASAAMDITALTRISGNAVTLPGAFITRFGTAAATKGDTSAPGMLLEMK